MQGGEVKLLGQIWVCDRQGWAQGHLQYILGRDQEQGLELNTLEGAKSPRKASPSSAPSSQVTQLHHLRASLEHLEWEERLQDLTASTKLLPEGW